VKATWNPRTSGDKERSGTIRLGSALDVGHVGGRRRIFFAGFTHHIE